VSTRTPDDFTGLLRQIRQRLDRLEHRRSAAQHWDRLPVPGNGTFNLVFPADLFSDPPTVLVTIEHGDQGAKVHLHNVTETGAQVTVHGAPAAGGPGVVHWHALAS
jgi:hypothetical protein